MLDWMPSLSDEKNVLVLQQLKNESKECLYWPGRFVNFQHGCDETVAVGTGMLFPLLAKSAAWSRFKKKKKKKKRRNSPVNWKMNSLQPLSCIMHNVYMYVYFEELTGVHKFFVECFRSFCCSWTDVCVCVCVCVCVYVHSTILKVQAVFTFTGSDQV